MSQRYLPLLRAAGALALLMLSASPRLAAAGAAPGARPNIVFILADDLGPDGVGCYGSEDFKNETPHIDKLAKDGVKFTHAYATAICSPTRAQYATGQYPFRNGVLDIDGSDYRSDPHKPRLTQMLIDAGYTTGKCGKSDIGPGDADEELNGWQYWATKEDKARWKVIGPSKMKAADYDYFPAAQLDFALEFIERNRPRPENNHKPFYFMFGFHNPHVPIERTPDSAPDEKDVGRLYRDNVRYIDKVVGRIVEKLREQGCLENTIVMFSGDNGSLNADRGARLQGKLLDPKSGTYRTIMGSKADRAENREGTALVPLIVSWPAGLAPALNGGSTDCFVDFSDFLPTFGEFAGAKIPQDWVIDGHSFAGLLRGAADYKPREWVYHQIENNWCLRGPGYRLNRDGRFFDMSDAPFAAKVLTNLTPEQQAIRDGYQAVLDKMNPAAGPTYEGHQDAEWKNPAWAWKQKWFKMAAWETPTAGDASDPDKDGVPNIFERAFGWNPTKAGDVMPKIVRQPDGALSVTLPTTQGNDTQVIVEVSGDGKAWTRVEPVRTGEAWVAVAKPQGTRAEMRLRAERETAWKEP